jgi:hypothetical protein
VKGLAGIMHKTYASLLILHITLGCAGRTEDDRDPGADAATGDPHVCDNCCVPFRLTPSDINVYRTSSSFSVELVVERLQTEGPTSAWSTVATVVTPWGGTQECQADIGSGTSGHSFIRCPEVAPPDEAICGSQVDVSVTLRSRTYATTSATAPACMDDDLGLTLTYTVPVECPICPSIDQSFDHQQCDYPITAQCSYQALMYGGTMGTLPCYCRPDSTTGERTWSCAVS